MHPVPLPEASPRPGSVLIKENNNNNNTQVVPGGWRHLHRAEFVSLSGWVGCLVLAEDLQRDTFDVATNWRLNGGVLRMVLL